MRAVLRFGPFLEPVIVTHAPADVLVLRPSAGLDDSGEDDAVLLERPGDVAHHVAGYAVDDLSP